VPEIDAGGCRLFFSVDGDSSQPVVLLSNALGTTTALWDRQVATLAKKFRVVRYDTRGHGRSSTRPGDYTIAELGRDALRILDAVKVDRADICGSSLGGLTALWLAVNTPDRVGRLVLANTGARIGSPELWRERIAHVRASGMGSIAEAAASRWFTPAFRSRHPEIVSAFTTALLAVSPEGYAGCAAALRDADLREDVTRIAVPTLVIIGKADPATPPADGEFLCARIAGARRVELDAAHLSNVEDADAFTTSLLEFLAASRNERWTTTHAARPATPCEDKSSATPTSTPPSRTPPR